MGGDYDAARELFKRAMRGDESVLVEDVIAAFLADNELYAPCPECEGSGRENSEIGICMTCIGRGFDRAGGSDE
jgi:hypothetical protein